LKPLFQNDAKKREDARSTLSPIETTFAAAENMATTRLVLLTGIRAARATCPWLLIVVECVPSSKLTSSDGELIVRVA
jgi:hypothetical protein